MSAMLSQTNSKFFAESLLVKPSVEAPAILMWCLARSRLSRSYQAVKMMQVDKASSW
jgi:hypothetical protein